MAEHAVHDERGHQLHGVVVDRLALTQGSKPCIENQLLRGRETRVLAAEEGGDAATLRENGAALLSERLLILLLRPRRRLHGGQQTVRRQLDFKLVVTLVHHLLDAVQVRSDAAVDGQVLDNSGNECRRQGKPRGLNIGETLLRDWILRPLILCMR